MRVSDHDLDLWYAWVIDHLRIARTINWNMWLRGVGPVEHHW